MTNPPTTPSDPDGEREKIARIVDPRRWEMHLWAKANSPTPHDVSDLLAKADAIAALRSPPSPGDEIQRLREAYVAGFEQGHEFAGADFAERERASQEYATGYASEISRALSDGKPRNADS